MKKNMGGADRIIRLLLAAGFAYLYFADVVTGIWGIVLAVVASIFTITSLFGVCPLYSLVGINTCQLKRQ